MMYFTTIEDKTLHRNVGLFSHNDLFSSLLESKCKTPGISVFMKVSLGSGSDL